MRHTLSNANWTATVDRTGGMVRRLTLGHDNLLRPMPDQAQEPRQASCYPLLPFANRIDQARLAIDGRVAVITPAPSEPHGLHGTGWHALWTLGAQSSDHLLLTLQGGGDPSWPWRWAAQQQFTLSASGLTIELILTNMDRVPAPASIGLHPAFVLGKGTRIETAIDGIWDCGPDLIPNGWRSTDWQTIGNRELDNCLTGWSGKAIIHAPDRPPITLTANTSHLQVYRPKDADFICLEPVTARPNVWTPIENTPAATAILDPQEQLFVTMTLSA